MNNKDIEALLKDYFKAEDKAFSIPDKSKTLAFSEQINTKRKFNLKAVSIIAACLALCVCISFVTVSLFEHGTYSEHEESISISISIGKNPPEWYSPGEFTVEQINVTRASAQSTESANGILPTAFIGNTVIAQTAKKSEKRCVLPEWVARTEVLNERFVLLMYDWHDFSEKEYIHPVYDIQTDTIRDIVGEIYIRHKDFIDKRNLNFREVSDMIQVYEFGISTEWGLFSIWDESGSYPTIEYFMANIETGLMKKLPRFANILAVSNDYKYIVWCYDDGNSGITISILDTETMQETITDIKQRPHTVFSDNGRFIVFYKPQKTADGGWSTTKAEWYLYDLENKSTIEGQGKILRFANNDKNIIAEDESGTHIYNVTDMSEAASTDMLEEYEKYIIESNKSGIYRVNLFDDSRETVLEADIETCTFWNGYSYHFIASEQVIAIYDEKTNNIFKYDISEENIAERNYNEISLYITDNGKKCNILTFYDDFYGKYEIYEGTVDENVSAIVLPQENSEANYGEGIVLYASPEGFSFTMMKAFRQGDTITFVSKETEYEMDVGIVFIHGEEMFVGITESASTNEGKNVWATTLFEREENGNADIYDRYMREFKRMLGDTYNEDTCYYMILNYHVINENGEEIYG